MENRRCHRHKAQIIDNFSAICTHAQHKLNTFDTPARKALFIIEPSVYDMSSVHHIISYVTSNSFHQNQIFQLVRNLLPNGFF